MRAAAAAGAAGAAALAVAASPWASASAASPSSTAASTLAPMTPAAAAPSLTPTSTPRTPPSPRSLSLVDPLRRFAALMHSALGHMTRAHSGAAAAGGHDGLDGRADLDAEYREFLSLILQAMLPPVEQINAHKDSIEPQLLRDLALTLQTLLQWKPSVADTVAAPKLTPDIEHRCVDLLVAGFESFFPTVEERVGAIHAITLLSLGRPVAASASIDAPTSATAAAAATVSSVSHALSCLARRYDVDHSADLSGLLFAAPDASITAPGTSAHVTDVLLQTARADWHGAAATVALAALSRKHRPHGRCVEHPVALANFLCVYLSQLFTSLSGTAATSGLPVHPSVCWPLFLQFLHLSFQHCNDLLDYLQFIQRGSHAASKGQQDAAVAAMFNQTQLSRILHFTLPLMRRALQPAPAISAAASSVASMHAEAIGDVLQSALALLVRLGALQAQSFATGAVVDPSAPHPSFRGPSLRSMLSLLRESHQYTTTVYRMPPRSSSSEPSHLVNILVPFASKVLSGLFWRFARDARSKHNARDMDEVTMSRAEFAKLYAMSAAPAAPPTTVGSVAAVSEGSVLPSRAPLTPLATMFSLAAPAAIPSATAAALSATSFVLPAAPAPIQRSHTASGLSSIASSATASSLLGFPPPSSLHFHLDDEWHKAVSACTGRTGSNEIDLAGFLKWNLDGFVEDSSAKIEQLRNLEKAIDWTEEDDEATHESERSARSAIRDLVLQLQDSFAMLLQEHVYPVASAGHTSELTASAPAPSDSRPLESSDDLGTLPNAGRRRSFDRTFPAVGAPPSRSHPAVSTSSAAAAAAVSASAEFLPRLMESEARWTHHPDHRTFLSFLDKFAQQEPTAMHTTAATSRSDRTRPSVNQSKQTTPGQTAETKKDVTDFTLPQAALLGSQSPSIVSAVEVPSLLSLPVVSVKNSANVLFEVSSKHLSERDDEKSSSKESSANNTPRTQRTLTVGRATTQDPVAPATSPLLSPMVPEVAVPSAPSIAASAFPGGELEEPARCFSSLFVRCVSEMGGGSAKKKVESWPAALQAEKAFAAACVKHNGLCSEVVQYSGSVAAVELLRLSLAVHPLTGLPRVRLLSHPSCPQWLKAVVHSTFQEVRMPLLQIMRAIEEEEEGLQQSSAPQAQKATVPDCASPPVHIAAPFGMLSQPSALFHAGVINSSMVARTVTAKKSFKVLRKLAAQARAMVATVHANSRFLAQELDGLQRSLAPKQETQPPPPQVSPVGEDDELEGDAADSDEEEIEPATAAATDHALPSVTVSNVRATMPTRYRSVARSSIDAGSPASSSLSGALHMPVHLIRAAAFLSERTRASRIKLNHATRMPSRMHESRMHESASSATLQQRPSMGSSIAGPSDSPVGDNSSPSFPPAALARQHSEIVRRRRHSVLTISPGLSAPTDDAAVSPLDDDTDNAQATASISTYLRGATNHGAAASASSPASELWSNWSTSASSGHGRAPYESKWLAMLVHCGSSTIARPGEQSALPSTSPLRDLLQPSIQRFQSVCVLRLKLLTCINKLCSDPAHAFAIQLVDHIFPTLHQCLDRYPPHNQEAHLLHYGRLIMRMPRHDKNNNVMLHFLKHLVAAINSQLEGQAGPSLSPLPPRERSGEVGSSAPLSPVSYDAPAWLRIRSCLHLLRLDFLAEDTESIVGSGVFAALFRTIRHIDDSIQADAAATTTLQPRTGDLKAKPAGTANMSPSPSPMFGPSSNPTAAHRMPSWQLGEDSMTPFLAPSLPIQLDAIPPASASHPSADPSLPSTLRFAAAYHLKFLCWQTLTHLSQFLLSSHQRGLLSNSVLLSSVARQFVRMLLQQLEVMAQAPPKLPLQHDDGSLRFTMDAATILCQFTKFKSVCDAQQMEQMMQLSTAAPASIQTVIMQLIASELHRVRPADLDSAASSVSSSPLSVMFVQQMLVRIGQKAVANTVLSSVCQTQTGLQSRSQSSTADSAAIGSQLFSPILPGRPLGAAQHPAPLSLDETSLPSDGPRGSRQSSAASASVSVGDDSRPPFWHESGYQSWRFYPHFHAVNLQSEPALVEEIISAMRSLLSDRHWRPIIVQQLHTQLAQLPIAVHELREAQSTASTSAPSLQSSLQSGLAALAVLGGHTFQLRKGALVEVLLHARRSVRGTVSQIDTHLCRVLVRLSPSQPQAATKPYARAQQHDSTAQSHAAHDDHEFHAAPLIEQEFSFDQVRACPVLPAPLLTDIPGAAHMWTCVRDSLQTAIDAILSPPVAQQPDSLSALLCMQITKQLVQLLHVQLSATLSKLRRRASNRTGSIRGWSTHASPTMSPSTEPMGSPMSPHGSDGEFCLNAPALHHASPSPAPSPNPSPEPTAAGGVARLPSSILSQLQSATGQQTVRSPTASNLRVVMQAVSDPPASSAADSVDPLPLPFIDSVDFTSVLPLLLRLSSSVGHRLLSLSLFELEQSSALFSRRLWEVIKAEQKHSRMWECSSADTTLKGNARGLPAAASSTGEIAHLIEGSERVTFVPFADAETSTRTIVGVRSEMPAYRRALISALRRYFSTARSQAAARSRVPRLRSQPLPRLLIFPLQASGRQSTSHGNSAAACASSSSTPSCDSGGILVVEIPASGVKRDQPECKEATADADVPRLLTLSDLGVNAALASTILPLGPATAEDSDEAEAEAMELVLGTGCHPEQWTAERWEQELIGQSTPEGRTPMAPRAPQAGHVAVLSRRVIIGPNGHAAVLTSATPATSRANSPTGHRTAHLQIPSNRPGQTAPTSVAHTPPNAAATSSSSSSSAAVPPLGGHLAAKFVRTTTHAERQALVDHIASVSRQQSPDPARWQLYDFVDARDSYGDWYLAQIIGFKMAQSHDDSPSTVREAALLHFFAWDDMYREWIALSSAAPPPPPILVAESLPAPIRLRPASLFVQSVDRLESDRFIRKVKVFGRDVVEVMKRERELAALVLARDQAKQIASIALSDAYSYPLCAATFAGSAGTVGQKLDGSALSVGTQVLVTGGCVELLSLQLGRGLVSVASEYRVGDRLMVLDTVNKLCEAEILECRSAVGGVGRGGNAQIKIHYIGWPSKWDELLHVTSDRIQSKRGFGAAASAFKKRAHSHGTHEQGAGLHPAVESKRRAFASWNGAGGHAAQLIGLVGQIAVITKLAQAPRSFGDLLGDRLDSAAVNRASDTLAQVQLLDPQYGSLVCFWTRLQLLRRMDQVDVPHISLPGLLQCDSDQLRAALHAHEQMLIGTRVSQLVQAIVKLQTTASGASNSSGASAGTRRVAADLPLSPTLLLSSPTNAAAAHALLPSLAGSLPSLPNVRQEQSLSWPASATTPADVTSSQHLPSCTHMRASLPTPAHPAVSAASDFFLQSFRAILASLPRVSQLVLSSHLKCASGLQDPSSSAHNVCESSVVVHPRHRPQLSAAAMEHAQAQRRHTFVQAPKDAAADEDHAREDAHDDRAPQLHLPPAARSSLASQPRPLLLDSAVSSPLDSSPEPLVVQAWLSERMYRNLNAAEWDKLEILGSLVALLLVRRPESSGATDTTTLASQSDMQLTSERVAFLADQCTHLSQALLDQFTASRRKPVKDPDSLDSSSTLVASSTTFPAASSCHIQTIRPGEVVRLFSAQPGVHALFVCWTRSSQPNFEVSFVSSTSDQSQRIGSAAAAAGTASASASSDSSSWYSGSPSPPPPASSTGAPICPLSHLKSVPVLRAGASPLLLPNPCYLVASLSACAEKQRSAPGAEDEIEAADDDFSILVSPLSSVELEAFAAFTEVVLHLRREVRITPALVEWSVAEALDGLLLQTLHCWVEFLSQFQSVCAWPCARYKGMVFELVAHLMAELSRSLRDSIEAWSTLGGARLSPSLLRSLCSFGFSWLHPFVSELRDRYAAEKENWPLFSSYTHRAVEMMVAALQLQDAVMRMQDTSSATASFRPIPSAGVGTQSTHAISFGDAEADEDATRGERDDSRDGSSTPSSSMRSRGESPSIYTTPPPGPASRDELLSGHGHRADDPLSSLHSCGDEVRLSTFLAVELPVIMDIHTLIVSKRHLFLRCTSSERGPKCACHDCSLIRGENPSLDSALMLLDFASSLWPLLLGGSMLLLPHAARYRLFDELINVTASPERWLPEFPFTTAKERALAAELALDAGAAPSSPVAPDDSESDSTWQQLCKALQVTPEAHLRGKLGDVTWKARFKGLHNRGAEGLPGPFRQSLTEICSDLRNAATASVATTGASMTATASVSGAASSPVVSSSSSSSSSLSSSSSSSGRASILLPAPNFVYDTGLDRNKLLLNPLPLSVCDGSVLSDCCFRFGQLLGVAIRSQGVLDIDMASLVWKLLADESLSAMDLASVDYTAYKQLQFRDADTGVALTQFEFNDQLSESLRWTTTLSDGVTVVELVSGGSTKPVHFAQRHQYARAVLRARLEECRLSVNHIRSGLYSVVPARAIQLLTWRELELRVCGSPQLDLDLLARHTVYAPARFVSSSPVVRWFWRALRELSAEGQAQFMQFAWARGRLPPESGKEGTWRMKLNILESAGPHDLPTAETCFFNLNLPLYGDYDTLQAKLTMAITHCSSINS